MFMNAKNDRVPLGSTHMDYVVFGRGNEALIMLPGLGDGLRTVRGMALTMALTYRKLGSRYRVFVFSRKSDLPAGCSTRDMAADQAAAMEAMGIDRAHILGVSQGGMIAQHLAIDYPDKVAKLILAVSTAKTSPMTQGVLARWTELMRQGDYGEIMVDTAEHSYSDAYLKKYRFLYPLLRRMGKPQNPKRFIIQAEACMGHSAVEELERIKAPTLIIGGGKDKVVGSEAAWELHESIPGSEVVVYEGLGHAAYEEAKDFQELLLSFLTE
ncbi:MAG: alpha/beta hydrolase [Ruminococcaceae bacterium]|nr:alpha/beta hydrolase [Oscillospiraceae bacterium]